MNTFSLQIVTPDGAYFDGPALRVRLRTIDGDVAIMAGHIPYVTAISIGECRVVLPDETERSAACCGGMLSVGDCVRVIATTFEWAEDIDTARAKAALDTTKQRLENGVEDEALRASLQEHLRRAETRLRVAAQLHS